MCSRSGTSVTNPEVCLWSLSSTFSANSATLQQMCLISSSCCSTNSNGTVPHVKFVRRSRIDLKLRKRLGYMLPTLTSALMLLAQLLPCPLTRRYKLVVNTVHCSATS
jgi:hypothetical protein